MRKIRSRRKRKATSKITLLFIILILSLASISASYAQWEEILSIGAIMDTTEWDEQNCDPIIAYEDLPIIIGTGTQGYWKNHPDAWPVETITIGGITYSKTEAIDIMDQPGKGDKTYDMFDQLVAAKLNVFNGCESSCIDQTIHDADTWLSNNPVGSNVKGSDPAWQNEGSSLHTTLDNYNNGLMCAPSRDTAEDSNDYDYNDFIVKLNIKGNYIHGSLIELTFGFEAMARGAAYHHDLNLMIPSGTFGENGNYTLIRYDIYGNQVYSTGDTFQDSSNIDLEVFPDTWQAIAPNPPGSDYTFSANTVDNSGTQIGRKTVITFNFSGFFGPDHIILSDYTLDYIGNHAENLFFDLYLHVWNTGENIHKGDSRVIAAPTEWEWPQERAPIWEVYPFNSVTGEGVKETTPPVFTNNWCSEPPTNGKWEP